MFFFFNDTATTEIYTLSLHDALPICTRSRSSPNCSGAAFSYGGNRRGRAGVKKGSRWYSPRLEQEITLIRWGHWGQPRSEEHTSELQSRQYLVCRLLLVKKKRTQYYK